MASQPAAPTKMWLCGSYAIAASASGPIDIDALADWLKTKRTGQSGRKPPDIEAIQAAVAALPFEARTTYHSAAHHTGLSRSSLHRYTQRGYLNNVSAFIKPALTEAHMSYDPDADVLSASFASFDDIIHLDEKIFRVMKTRTRYIFAPMDEQPHRPAQSKRYVGQVMFLAAVAKPRWLDDKQRWFYGKLGLWPFLEMVPAQRSSKNRPRGTPVPTAVSVTSASFMAMINDKLGPVIEAKWPRRQCPQAGTPIFAFPGHTYGSADSRGAIVDMVSLCAATVMDGTTAANLNVGFYSIMIAESNDISTSKNLVVMARYVANGMAKTSFLGLVALDDGTAATVDAAVLSLVDKRKLVSAVLVGFATDGASVTRGRIKGLAIEDALEAFDNERIAAIRATNGYFNKSHVRRQRLAKAAAALGIRQLRPLQQAFTRWLSLGHALDNLQFLIPAIRQVLANDLETLMAKNLYNTFYNTSYEYWVAAMNDIVREVNFLSKALQSECVNIVCVLEVVCAKKEQLRSTFVEPPFSSPPTTPSLRRIASIASVAALAATVTTVDEDLTLQQCEVETKHLVQVEHAGCVEFVGRLLEALRCASPKRPTVSLPAFGVVSIDYLVETYRAADNLLQLVIGVNHVTSNYTSIVVLLKIALTMAHGSVDCERAFSLQNLIKFKSRNGLSRVDGLHFLGTKKKNFNEKLWNNVDDMSIQSQSNNETGDLAQVHVVQPPKDGVAPRLRLSLQRLRSLLQALCTTGTHPELSWRKGQVLDAARFHGSNEPAVRRYYENEKLAAVITKYPAASVWNCDETSVCAQGRRPPRVVCPKGMRANCVRSSDRKNVSLLACISASGEALPPMYIFVGKRKKACWFEGGVKGMSIAMTDSSYIQGHIFMAWINWFIALVGSRGPQLLILDGHFSHLLPDLLHFAHANGVAIFTLRAHTSGFLQPCDAQPFSTFKSRVEKAIHEYPNVKDGKLPTRDDIVQLTRDSWLAAMTPENINSGLMRCGIFSLSLEIMLQGCVGDVPAGKSTPMTALALKNICITERMATKWMTAGYGMDEMKYYSRCGPLSEVEGCIFA
ncbi:hypothetical protein ACHHYP_20397 [Achlya hypogyna]|uniref:DDE-1 domain-containing protein n=1 Tax=Achlya hypogyna TaxID=1202772 RepID=A0A1V9ZK82_ACHHY|nr:hypothetical protein ACHHYP_20397 [Achlya hypogyna]